MSPIFTKYLARAALPARIKAYTLRKGEACYVFPEPHLSEIDNHRAAVAKLARNLHWQDQHFTVGPMPHGFVFVPCDVVEEPHTHHSMLWPTAAASPTTVRKPREHATSNGAVSPARTPADTFCATLTAAGVPPEIVTRLTALGPAGLTQQYHAGRLRFPSKEVQIAFVEALIAWNAA